MNKNISILLNSLNDIDDFSDLMDLHDEWEKESQKDVEIHTSLIKHNNLSIHKFNYFPETTEELEKIIYDKCLDAILNDKKIIDVGDIDISNIKQYENTRQAHYFITNDYQGKSYLAADEYRYYTFIGFQFWNISNLTNLCGAFYYNRDNVTNNAIKEIAMWKNHNESLNVSNMFAFTNIKQVYISRYKFMQDKWLNADQLFYNCQNLETLGINTSNITLKISSASIIFGQCIKLSGKELLKFFDVAIFKANESHIIQLGRFAEGCQNLSSNGILDLKDLHIKGLKDGDFVNMSYGLNLTSANFISEIHTIDLSNLLNYSSNITFNLYSLFSYHTKGCSKLILNNWNFDCMNLDSLPAPTKNGVKEILKWYDLDDFKKIFSFSTNNRRLFFGGNMRTNRLKKTRYDEKLPDFHLYIENAKNVNLYNFTTLLYCFLWNLIAPRVLVDPKTGKSTFKSANSDIYIHYHKKVYIWKDFITLLYNDYYSNHQKTT